MASNDLELNPLNPELLATLQHAALVAARRPTLEAQAANLASKVDRIVVLMLENRSFDHLLGWVGFEKGGLTGEEFCPLVAPAEGAPPVPKDSEPGFAPFVTGETRLPISPTHAGGATLRQINRGTAPGPGNMQGFLQEFATHRQAGIRFHGEIGGEPAEAMPMATYAEESLLAYAHLVRHEAVCGSWHASVPAGTWPNRMYLYSGTCGGQRGNGNVVVRDETYDATMPELLVDRLDAAETPVTWCVYTHSVAWMRVYPGRQKGFAKNTRAFRKLKGDCKDGGAALPQVVFVDPRFVAYDAIPNLRQNDDLAPANLVDGQQLVADVYRALAELPAGERQRTMLVVLYDEHGGFYDHVPPPATIGKNPDEDPETFRSYGVRIPAFVCSAYAPAGTGSSMLFDHASLHATLLRRFLPGAPFPSRRAEVANTLGALLTLDEPREAFPVDDLPGDLRIGVGARQQERQDRRDDRREDRRERVDDRRDDRDARVDGRRQDREDRVDDRISDRRDRVDDRRDDHRTRVEDRRDDRHADRTHDERVEDRRDDRAGRVADRQRDRADRVADRHADRAARIEDRQDDRAARVDDRQEDRTAFRRLRGSRVEEDDDDGMAAWIASLGEPDGG